MDQETNEYTVDIKLLLYMTRWANSTTTHTELHTCMETRQTAPPLTQSYTHVWRLGKPCHHHGATHMYGEWANHAIITHWATHMYGEWANHAIITGLHTCMETGQTMPSSQGYTHVWRLGKQHHHSHRATHMYGD